MKSDFNNLLDNEDEQFLQQLSEAFKDERERLLIRETVARKIASTDFGKAASGGLSFLNLKFIIPALLIIGAASFFVFSGIDSSNNKQENQLASVEKVDKHSEPGNTVEKEALAANNSNEVSKAETTVAESNTKASKKQKKLAVSGLPEDQAKDIPLKTETAKFNLNKRDVKHLEAELVRILNSYNLKASASHDSGSLLDIKTEEANGIADGKPARYSLTLKIRRTEPDVLYMSIFYQNTGNKTKSKTGRGASDLKALFRDLNKAVQNLVNG